MSNHVSTKENINRLTEFRQALYQHGFLRRQDALCELLDALLVQGPVPSFPWLSCSDEFQRKWHSLYAALQDGRLDEAWLRQYLAQQMPPDGIVVLALDVSAWPRPRAQTLEDRQYVYHPTAAVNGGSVCVGYAYSLLDWVPEPRSSWALSLDVRRVPSTQTAQEVGVQQVKAFCAARQQGVNALDIVAADVRYGNVGFLQPLQRERCAVLTRLRRDRVLYREVQPDWERGRGRPRKHGARFAFKQSASWGTPAEAQELEDAQWGKVRIERWNKLHDHQAADVPFDVLRVSVHLEKAKPPQPIWLAWQPPSILPAGITVTAEAIWRAYQNRWPIEPSIRFRKQSLCWTLPQFQMAEAGDRWSVLVSLAMWILYLARSLVEDSPLPWQKPQTQLTPERVRQGIRPIIGKIGSPARPPKTRGKPPGWPKGKPRQPKPRFRVVKKAQVAAKAA